MTIAHQIVQEHGGYVEVFSEVGHGTKFMVSLPVNPYGGVAGGTTSFMMMAGTLPIIFARPHLWFGATVQ